MALTKIKTQSINDDAITTAKINNNAVTDAKVADDITAGTAATLATARSINGVSFNGSSAITVTAAAGTLTGNTLASGVTASSLTSVGTLGSTSISTSSAQTAFSVTSSQDASNKRGASFIMGGSNAGMDFGIFVDAGSNVTSGSVIKGISRHASFTGDLLTLDCDTSASGAVLINAKDAGTSKFKVLSTGDTTIAGHATFTSGKYLNMNSANSNWLIGRNIGTPSGGHSLDHAMQIKVYSATNEGFEIYNHDDENLLSIQGSSGSTWIRGYCEVGSQVYTGDGSAGAPALTFTGDSNTGIYRSGGDTLNFSTGGTNRMTLNSNGEFGIGTASPNELLHIYNSSQSWDAHATIRMSSESDSYASEIGFHRGTSNDNDRGLFLSGNGSSKHVSIKHDGNVGINKTNPSKPLHILVASEVDDNTILLDVNTVASVGDEQRIGWTVQDTYPLAYIGSSFESDTTDGYLAFGTRVSNSVAEKMRITSGGNVGIGTSAPISPSGYGTTLSLASGGEGPAITFQDTGETNKKMYILNQSGNLKIGNMDDDGGGVTHRMLINSSGNVGIGDTSPDYRLDVEGNDPGSYVASFTNDGDSENRYGVRIQCGHDNASDTNFAITIADGDGGEQGYVTFTSGTITWGAFTANHDAELPSSDNSDGYPYGTLVETENLFYTKNHDGSDLERGIRYKVKKTSSAYSKKILGAYAGKYPTDMYENQHQIYVLGDGHILCNGEKGNIEVGDGICTSSTDGEGMKADKMAMIIGIAQEDVSFSGSESKLVAVQYGLQQFTPWESE